jgi:hypothetical protein
VSAFIACLRAQIYDPVSSAYDIKIMFYDHYRMSLCKKSIEGLEKFLHIVEMQSGSRFIKDEEYPLLL